MEFLIIAIFILSVKVFAVKWNQNLQSEVKDVVENWSDCNGLVINKGVVDKIEINLNGKTVISKNGKKCVEIFNGDVVKEVGIYYMVNVNENERRVYKYVVDSNYRISKKWSSKKELKDYIEEKIYLGEYRIRVDLKKEFCGEDIKDFMLNLLEEIKNENPTISLDGFTIKKINLFYGKNMYLLEVKPTSGIGMSHKEELGKIYNFVDLYLGMIYNKSDSDLELSEKTALYICNNFNYIPDIKDINPSNHTVSYFIFNRQGVCDSYSGLYSILMNSQGIPTEQVSGRINNENHAWNAVEFSDGIYYTDLTYSDFGDYQDSLGYFNMSLQDLILNKYIPDRNLKEFKSGIIYNRINCFDTITINTTEELNGYINNLGYSDNKKEINMALNKNMLNNKYNEEFIVKSIAKKVNKNCKAKVFNFEKYCILNVVFES